MGKHVECEQHLQEADGPDAAVGAEDGREPTRPLDDRLGPGHFGECDDEEQQRRQQRRDRGEDGAAGVERGVRRRHEVGRRRVLRVVRGQVAGLLSVPAVLQPRHLLNEADELRGADAERGADRDPGLELRDGVLDHAQSRKRDAGPLHTPRAEHRVRHVRSA